MSRRCSRSRRRVLTGVVLSCCVTLGMQPGLAQDADQPTGYVWWEAEEPSRTNFPPPNLNPFRPANAEQADLLSGGTWIGVEDPRDETLFLDYVVEIPESGTYTFLARKFWYHGPYRYRWNDGPWVEPGEVALLDNAELRTHVVANWTRVGRVRLNRGKHRLRIELLDRTGAAAFDCFILTRRPFKPAGRLKPGERLNRAEEGWFPFEPDEIEEAAAINLRRLNERSAGDGGFIGVKNASFVHLDTGEPVRFWGVNLRPEVAHLDDASLRQLAAQLARSGVNLVRFHGPMGDDGDIAQVNEQLLERLHFLVAAMQSEGIYTGLSVYFPLWVRVQADDPIAGYDGEQSPFGLLVFDSRYQQRYRKYIERILTSPNPYTGKPLARDPAVAYFEIQNEDSVFFWTFEPYQRLPEPLTHEIEKRFADWLVNKYGSVTTALRRWDRPRIRGDAPEEGRVGLVGPWKLITEQQSVRSRDTAAFLTDAQRRFYEHMVAYLRDDLGFKPAITCSNWQTADDQVLGPLEYWTYAAGDFVDHHGYFGGDHVGQDSSWSLRPRHQYTDRAAPRLDGKTQGEAAGRFEHPLLQPVWNNLPTTISELSYPLPNRFRADFPIVAASYGNLLGVEAIIFFTLEGPRWVTTHGKFSIQSPVVMGQFPATALIYRTGMVEPGPVMARIDLDLASAQRLHGMPWRPSAHLDELRAADVTNARSEANDREQLGRTPIDPRTLLIGQVHINVAPGLQHGATISNIKRYLDPKKGQVRSATGQLAWNYSDGVIVIDAPQAQGAVGFLDLHGKVQLTDVAVDLGVEYGSALVVSLDGQPLKRSRRMLLQVASEERNYGWRTKRQGELNAIVALGRAPVQVRQLAGTVTLPPAGPYRTTALTLSGMLTDDTQRSPQVELRPNVLYYLVERTEPPDRRPR